MNFDISLNFCCMQKEWEDIVLDHSECITLYSMTLRIKRIQKSLFVRNIGRKNLALHPRKTKEIEVSSNNLQWLRDSETASNEIVKSAVDCTSFIIFL